MESRGEAPPELRLLDAVSDQDILSVQDIFSDCYTSAAGRPLRITGEMQAWPLLHAAGALDNVLTAAGTSPVEALRFEYSADGVQIGHRRESLTLQETCRRAQNQLEEAPKEAAWYLQWRNLPAPPSASREAGSDSSLVPPGTTAPTTCGADSGSGAFTLMQLVRRPLCISSAALREANAWIGVSRTSQLHFDGLDNFLAVAHGCKEVHLYSPWQLSSLYPQLERSERYKSAARSRLYLLPSATDFPLLRRAPCLKVSLSAGQMLYIPAGWWHEVLTPEFTIAFNFWFAPHARSKLRPTLLHLHSDLYAERAMAAGAARSEQVDEDQEGPRDRPSKRQRPSCVAY